MATGTTLATSGIMATLFGNIGEFDETQEEWKQYAERLDHFFAANGVIILCGKI